jgi:hypothetical protein
MPFPPFVHGQAILDTENFSSDIFRKKTERRHLLPLAFLFQASVSFMAYVYIVVLQAQDCKTVKGSQTYIVLQYRYKLLL